MSYRAKAVLSHPQFTAANPPTGQAFHFGIAVKYLASDPGFRVKAAASGFMLMLAQRNPVLVFSFSSCLFPVSLGVQF